MILAELHKLPPIEKLKIIEALWGDLAADEVSVQSPGWHETELLETEESLHAGTIEGLDWGEAKEALRREFE